MHLISIGKPGQGAHPEAEAARQGCKAGRGEGEGSDGSRLALEAEAARQGCEGEVRVRGAVELH